MRPDLSVRGEWPALRRRSGQPLPRAGPVGWLTGSIDDGPDDFAPDDEVDPDRIAGCAYWRCGELFEQRSANHRFCRKACRSRQHKWERAQERRRARQERRTRSS